MSSGSWYWPDVSDEDGAKDAMRLRMWCAIPVASVTGLFVVFSFFGIKLMGITPSALLDAVLFAAIALWVFQVFTICGGDGIRTLPH
jgi:hypothetical protein